ncbi:MAG: hypothetical protein ACFFFG_08080 [Candidatus Thorarchaeota archaeon]
METLPFLVCCSKWRKQARSKRRIIDFTAPLGKIGGIAHWLWYHIFRGQFSYQFIELMYTEVSSKYKRQRAVLGLFDPDVGG